ncbi:GNAT family N-acetyltransferase [Mammaliicoccus sciuri]|uniref:GNAT family N-acetyltransferase n=1 Tax=Mammaliicoccus TaxID=2803850 RepID=UPI00197DB9FC|nr:MULTISPECIES: GNAT family N-acetyltransferase [Mammaliicoccus]MCD8837505.1 GNAT family N-acetyltransferase [Mammaliicoccus sciuri]MCJ0939923.1 GNAT family N-acetyltransferase [Mammaliicoccus sciuri]MCJ0965798.1 GNAT family N-acetyltransferase [Mammaliicoccus sciuri]MDC5694225.1 GNAT family N-acetyltransferase [Mammaliicoccus sciuri]MEB6228109.1 GNAT family N-acetyltransferase [Mammaliicoccus sciuri]
MEYSIKRIPSNEDLQKLYLSVGWDVYVKNNEDMTVLLKNACYFVTVWDNDQLLGLTRVISDDHSIAYVQDILIDPDYQGNGIGSKLLNMIKERFNHVRQVVLMTDTSEKTINFYEKNELLSLDKYDCTAFMKINQ